MKWVNGHRCFNIQLLASLTRPSLKEYCRILIGKITARFGCVRAKLLMSRPLYIPLICFFLPSGLAVLVSWLVAYVDRNRIQTRLTLLIFSSFIVFFIVSSSCCLRLENYLLLARYNSFLKCAVLLFSYNLCFYIFYFYPWVDREREVTLNPQRAEINAVVIHQVILCGSSLPKYRINSTVISSFLIWILVVV